MLAKRLIPCLDVRDGQVVKGVRFRDHRIVGDILELATRYRDAGADELVFYDITASPEGRSVDRSWVERIARVLDIPFCVAGGIRSVGDAEAILNAGAEKVSINSPALENPALIDALARRFGSQCVVVGIDSETTPEGYREPLTDFADLSDLRDDYDPTRWYETMLEVLTRRYPTGHAIVTRVDNSRQSAQHWASGETGTWGELMSIMQHHLACSV